MSSEETRAFFLRWNEEVWNRKRLDLVDELVSDYYYRHDPSVPHEVRGRDGLKQLIGMYFTAFPDLHLAPEEVIAEGNRVAVLQTATATHRGEFMGRAPTGNAVSIKVMEMFRIEDHKIVEQWVSVDALNLLAQLGAL